MPLEPGTLLLDRYRIERILAQGGFGAVYEAADENLGLRCALKENLSLSPASERQFKREARLLATLRHPHLPRVTNHFISAGQQYLVMDLVEGDDLGRRLKRQGRLEEDEVLGWAEQICDALAYLHWQDPPIIHRDVKPTNIKITPAGAAMLVDFGIAKAGAGGQVTSTGAKGVTPGFAPPEQYDLGHTETRTDIYALGATLYNLLTGLYPPDSVDRLIGMAMLIRPEVIRPGLSPHVASAITKAMEVRPEDRFPSVEQFAAALAEPSYRYESAEDIPAGELAPPAPAEPRIRPSEWVRGVAQTLRRALPSMLGALGVLAALAVVFIGPKSLATAGRAWLGIPAALSVVPGPGETLQPASFARVVPTATSTATHAAEVVAPTPRPLPTPTPRPEAVTTDNATGWRLFARWRQGERNVPFALDPEGNSLLLVSRQGVDTFDLVTGERLGEVQGFIVGRTAYELAHLGDSVLVQFDDEILRYDLATKNLIESIRVSGRDMLVSPDGSMLAVREEYIRVLNLKTGELQATLGEKDTRQQYAFSPDGRQFALTDRNSVELYDSRSGRMLATLVGHGEPTEGLAFTPDGAYLVSASGDVWEVASRERISTFDSSAHRVAVSPNSQVIVGDDGSVWALATGEQIGSIPFVGVGTLRLLFTPEGQFLVRHVSAGEIEVWSVDPYRSVSLEAEAAPATLPVGEEITPFNISRLARGSRLANAGVGRFVISPDWTTASTWDQASITITSLITGEVVRQIRVSGRILAVDYLGSEFITVINAFRHVERWEVATGRLKQTYDFLGHTIVGSPAASFFAVQEKYIQVVDALTGDRVFNLGSAVTVADKYSDVYGLPSDIAGAGSETGIPFQDFAFSPDGSLLAITSGSGVGLWELERGTRVAHLIGHGPQTRGLSFTPDGSRLLSSSGDVWDVETGERLAAFDTEATALAISPTGELIAGDDGSLWDGATGQYLGDLGVRAVALWFTPNNRQLVFQSTLGSVDIYGIQPKAAHVSPDVSGATPAGLVDLNPATAPRISLIGWWGEDPLLEVRNERDLAAPQASFYGEGGYKHIALGSDRSTIVGLEARGVDILDPATGSMVDRYRIFLNPSTIQEIAFLGEHLLVLKEKAGIERWDLMGEELVQRYSLAGSVLTPSPDGDHFALLQGNRLLLVEADSGETRAQITVSAGAQSLSFSPDGELLAVVRGSVAELWEVRTARRIGILYGHGSRVYGLAFTPDGTLLAAASGDIWEVSSGDRLAGFDSGARQVAITPAGDLLIGDDGALREIEGGRRIATLMDLRAPAAQWLMLGDGRRVVSRTEDGRIYLWGVRSGGKSEALSIGPGAITALQAAQMARQSHLGKGRLQDAEWSPDQRYLAVNTRQNAVILHAYEVRQVRSILDARVVTFDHQGQALVGGDHPLQLIDPLSGAVIKDYGLRGITRAAFSPDGEHLAVAGRVAPDGAEDGLAVITLANGGLRVIDGGGGVLGDPIGLDFTPDSSIVVLSFQGTIKLWELESGKELRQPIRGNTRPASISPDGQHLAYLTHRFVVEDLKTGGQYRTINADGTPFFASGLDVPALRPVDYDFTPAGKLLVFYRRLNRRTFEEDLALIEWDIDAQPVTAEVRLEGLLSLTSLRGLYMQDYASERPQQIPAFGLSPRGTLFYSLTGDGVIRIWNASGGSRRGASRADSLDLMALSPDGETVAVPSAPGSIDILDTASGELIRTLSGTGSPSWLAYSSPSVLMLIDEDGSLSLIDAIRGHQLDQFMLGSYGGPENFILGPEGRLFANLKLSAGRNLLQVYALNAGTPLMDLDRYPLPQLPAFSPDGLMLAMARRDRVELWDLQTGSIVAELQGLGRSIGPLIFTPDGTRLIAASGEIWDLARGELSARFETTDPSMSIRTNGHIVVGQDGSLWDASSGAGLGALPGMRQKAVDLTFTPDGARLIWQIEGGVIEVWAVSP